jgi:AbrB family looped-hinge helix DNA binding protein
MSKLVRVGKKGRITIPVEFRRKLGIKEGDILEIEALDGKIVMRPVPK